MIDIGRLTDGELIALLHEVAEEIEIRLMGGSKPNADIGDVD